MSWKQDREIQERDVVDVESWKRVHLLGVSGNSIDDGVDSQCRKSEQNSSESNWKTETNQSFLNIVNLSRGFVVLQVHRLSPPRVGVDFGDPNGCKHQVLNPFLLLEV